MHHLGPGLGIRQSQRFAGNVHVLPPQRHDLAEATTGQHEEPSRSDGGGDTNKLSDQRQSADIMEREWLAISLYEPPERSISGVGESRFRH